MKGNIIYIKTIPGKNPEYVPFPENLHPDIISFLNRQHIQALYTHQAETFQHAMEKRNVVITTPTASGKSLCFYLPVLQEILQNPFTRTLFIYPTKALAADQYRALMPWMEYLGEHRLSIGVYGGDTSLDERKLAQRYSLLYRKIPFYHIPHYFNTCGNIRIRELTMKGCGIF